LKVVAPHIKNVTVLFPRTGYEDMLGQIFDLGVESHDAYAMLWCDLFKESQPKHCFF
jgi:hypothetical protein